MNRLRFIHCALALLVGAAFAQAGFSEPPITFYGQVSNRQGRHVQPVISGRMTWVITLPGRTPLAVSTDLQPLRGGFSYRLEVPVEKIVGAPVSNAAAVSALPVKTMFESVEILINGLPAKVISGASQLHYAETQRGKITRVDLQLSQPFADTDGDGIPDFAEEEYGLDPNDPTDAKGDANGDGVDNVTEYRNGTNPSVGIYGYAEWAADHQLTGALAAKDADPDLDGEVNLVEFALDGDPLRPDRAVTLSRARGSYVMDGKKTFLQMLVSKPERRRLGIEYRVEVSTDLVRWTRLGNFVDADAELLVRDPAIVERQRGRQRFIRLRIVDATEPQLVAHAGVWGMTQPAFVAGTVKSPRRRPISLPFELPLAAQGRATESTGNTVTDSLAAWSEERWTATPHFITFTAGIATGLSFLIREHTEQTLTLDTGGIDLTNFVVADAPFDIRPAHTLGSIFGTPPAALTPGPSETDADTVQLWGGSTVETYYHDGTAWAQVGTIGNRNQAPIAPGAGVFIERRTRRTTRPVFFGLLPRTPRATVLGPGETFVGTAPPTVRTLKQTGLSDLPGWSSMDIVKIWNGRAFRDYYHDGVRWHRVGSRASADKVRIQPGTAFFIDRPSPTSADLWLQGGGY